MREFFCNIDNLEGPSATGDESLQKVGGRDADLVGEHNDGSTRVVFYQGIYRDCREFHVVFVSGIDKCRLHERYYSI